MNKIALRPVQAAVPETARVLPGADFADAYRLEVSGQSLDAVSAAQRALNRAPGWISPLMRLRNALVKPFGLKTELKRAAGVAPRIDLLPVISQSPDRVVLGLDDKHLDFRLCVDVESLPGDVQAITASTVVRTHNALGRVYLTIVKPFHRIIVPAMLAQAAHR